MTNSTQPHIPRDVAQEDFRRSQSQGGRVVGLADVVASGREDTTTQSPLLCMPNCRRGAHDRRCGKVFPVELLEPVSSRICCAPVGVRAHDRKTRSGDLLDIGAEQLALSHATEALQKLPPGRITPAQADLLMRYTAQMRTAIYRATAHRGLS